jgi:hypothetical protein
VGDGGDQAGFHAVDFPISGDITQYLPAADGSAGRACDVENTQSQVTRLAVDSNNQLDPARSSASERFFHGLSRFAFLYIIAEVTW